VVSTQRDTMCRYTVLMAHYLKPHVTRSRVLFEQAHNHTLFLLGRILRSWIAYSMMVVWRRRAIGNCILLEEPKNVQALCVAVKIEEFQSTCIVYWGEVESIKKKGFTGFIYLCTLAIQLYG
jgi:hypothetical protein